MSLIVLLLLVPIVDCTSLLEVMLKFEFIYVIIIFLWLEHTNLSDQTRVIAILLLIVVCCESVVGITILMLFRSTKSEVISLPTNNKLRG